MISIAYPDLILTVIAMALVAIAVAAIWFVRRAGRTLDRYDRLVPELERVGVRSQSLMLQLEAGVEELRGAGQRATSHGSQNGAIGMENALGLVRQLTAVGSGIKAAVDTFQSTKQQQRHGEAR